MPEGSWKNRELPGPLSIDHRWPPFWVFRVTWLLLKAVSLKLLNNYSDMVRLLPIHTVRKPGSSCTSGKSECALSISSGSCALQNGLTKRHWPLECGESTIQRSLGQQSWLVSSAQCYSLVIQYKRVSFVRCFLFFVRIVSFFVWIAPFSVWMRKMRLLKKWFC